MLTATLADFWSGSALFVRDGGQVFDTTPPSGMHFTWDVAVDNDPQRYTYYILNESGGRFSTGLALTQDAVNFQPLGRVLELGPPGSFDDRIASFASVHRERNQWFMVYEAAGFAPQFPGDVALATSSDGIHWIKDAAPILVHRPGTWEAANIGTPSLHCFNGMWYVFYSGFDGQDVALGVAAGSDLRQLTRLNGGQPVIAPPSVGWNSGTAAGKRDIVFEGGWYYLIFEGSTDQQVGDFGNARWSSGLARSQDLVQWDLYHGSGGPVVDQTNPGYGFDGPEWVQTPDGELHVYYRLPTDGTGRSTLTPKAELAPRTYDAVTDLEHEIGRVDGDGWSADPPFDPEGFLSYGPYVSDLPSGALDAEFRLLVGNKPLGNVDVVTLDVYDFTDDTLLAERVIRRGEFAQPLIYQDFRLPFSAIAGHELEFRVYWHAAIYVRQRSVTVRPPRCPVFSVPPTVADALEPNVDFPQFAAALARQRLTAKKVPGAFSA